jgi:DNA-binding transcriptional LysR family regulator
MDWLLTMEMHQIRYFLAVAETLNFTRAAEHCNVAQPSLTRAIKKLEDELGGELFHREGRRTHMTDLGNIMLPLLTQSLDSAMAAKNQAQSYGKAEIANLRLGLSNTVDIRTMQGVLGELLRVMPDLELQISRGTVEEIEKGLEAGQTDIVLTAKYEEGWDRIVQWPLFNEKFVVVANSNHQLASKNELNLSDLEDQNIVNRAHCEQASWLPELLQNNDVNANFTHEVTSDADLEFLLNHDLGVSVIPETILFADDDFARLPIENGRYQRSLSLLAVAGRKYSKPVDLLIKLLRAKDWSVPVHQSA